MNILIIGNNYKIRPTFIIPEEMNKFKFLLEKELGIEIFINNIAGHKAIFVPIQKYEEALKIGFEIAEKENIKGIWFDIFRISRSLNCFPLKFYKIAYNIFENAIFDLKEDREIHQILKKEQEKRDNIKKYIDSLQRYLNHPLRIDYNLNGNIDISVYCSYKELEVLKNKCNEFEQLFDLKEILLEKNSYYKEMSRILK